MSAFDVSGASPAKRNTVSSIHAYSDHGITLRPCLVPRNWEELENNLIIKWEALSRYWFQFMGSKQALNELFLYLDCCNSFFIRHVQYVTELGAHLSSAEM
jgi:hypothetical protein